MQESINQDQTTLKHLGIVVAGLVGVAIGLIIAVSLIT